ncbi:protein kinase domain-containing protein [Sorangium sp. So ce117]|uniref:protein kinase domain-containing protein n=1 Tax=Sorangium sp. So ce117 TaxID=3133277 RepID=UPI003F61C2AF
MELRSGVRVDRYVLLDPLGRGAQGSVWRVRDLLDGAEKALKLFDLAALPKHGAERARREAQAVAKLKHPAIVTCHALFELPAEERLGLVFDLVRGRPLADVTRDAHMTPHHREALLVHLADALEHVHARGIVHRDLKPENILVADAFWEAPHAPGGMKLVDFGIAAAIGNPQGVTATGAFIGTRPYLGPDLLLPGRWGPSSDGFTRDIFAFGVLAWELLAGVHPTGLPFDAPIERYAAAYRDAAEGRRPWPPHGLVSPAAWVIGACVALDPARRLADGAALVAALKTGHVSSVSAAPIAGSVLAAPTETKDTRTEIDTARRAFMPAPSTFVPTAGVAGRGVPTSTAPMTMPIRRLPALSVPSSHVTPMPAVDTASGARPSATHEPRRQRATARWIVAGVTGAVLLAGTVSYVVATATLAARAPAPLPQSPAPTTPASPMPDVEPAAPIPCCGDGARCRSGRPCTAGTCTALLPDRWWYLRVTGVATRSPEQPRSGLADSFPMDLARTHPHSRVCMRRITSSSSTVCTSLPQAARTNDGDWENRLRVRTSDLVSGGLEIWVEDDGAELTRGISASNEKGISTSALCRGMSLYAGPRDTALARVFAYLDDG